VSQPPIIVVGAGGHGRVVADAALASGCQVLAFADEARSGTQILGIDVLPFEVEATVQYARRAHGQIVVAIGENRARRRITLALRAHGAQLATVVHPRASVSPHAKIGAGSVVLAQAVVAVGAGVGDGAIINHGASVDHDGQIGEFVHLSPGVHLGGEVVIGTGTHLAVGVSVRNRVRIGSWAVIGVGSAVVADISDEVVSYGVPARYVRAVDVPPEEGA
jgi:sugar O-acyltransferase (sialic acid O-acetyltransferase NeuD family)